MIWWRVFSCGTGTNYTNDHLFNPWGSLETPTTLNMKLRDAYEKVLKILPTSYIELYKIPPTENLISDDNDDDKDECF